MSKCLPHFSDLKRISQKLWQISRISSGHLPALGTLWTRLSRGGPVLSHISHQPWQNRKNGTFLCTKLLTSIIFSWYWSGQESWEHWRDSTCSCMNTVLQSRRMKGRKIILHRGSLGRGICCQTSTAVLERLGVYSEQRGLKQKLAIKGWCLPQLCNRKILGANLWHFFICIEKRCTPDSSASDL